MNGNGEERSDAVSVFNGPPPMLRVLKSDDRVWFRLRDRSLAPGNLASAFYKLGKKVGSGGADGQTVAHYRR